MESPLFLTDLLTGHEPENRKWLEIKGAIFRFMGRGNVIQRGPKADASDWDDPTPICA